MESIKSVGDIVGAMTQYYPLHATTNFLTVLKDSDAARKDFNIMREAMGLSQVRFTQKFFEEAHRKVQELSNV
jgi:hypothetical protein